MAWNRFDQTSELGDHFRFDAVSLRGTLHYYFTGSDIQPYAGIGVGGLYFLLESAPRPIQTMAKTA